MSITIQGLKGNHFIIDKNDELGMKMAMLFEGQCTIGVKAAIHKYGYTEQRYYQLLKKYTQSGSKSLINQKRGTKKQPVRTKEIINQIIRLRFLDPLSSAGVISQKLSQMGYAVSKRSVERTITEFGLQKKLIR
jgi:transposase